MASFVPENFPLPRRMAIEVPPCPACGRRDGIRERVMRADTEIDFWCCPPCGATWRVRVEEDQPPALA
jgi:hypothetical protein